MLVDAPVSSMNTSRIAAALQLDTAADTPASISFTANVALTRTGRAMRLVQDNGAAVQRSANPSLVKLLLKARRWWVMLREGKLDIKQLAAREGVQASYVTRVVRLTFLSLAVVDAIINGNVRSGVAASALTLGERVRAC